MYNRSYLEETHLISTKEYNYLVGERNSKVSEHIRKIYFNRDINYLGGVSKHQENFDRYSINIKNIEDSRCELERQCYRQGTYFSTYTYIDKEDAIALVSGQYQWMKKSQDTLVKALAVQIVANELEAGVVVDYDREIFHLHYSSDQIIFDKTIASTYTFTAQEAFSKDLVLKQRLEPKDCVMTFRQEVMVPKIMANLLTYHEGYSLIAEGNVE